MGRSMQAISRRIRGVSSTMQITRAMEMVSSVKLRRAREVLESSKPYYKTVLKNIQGILSTVKGVRHPLLEEREIKTTLYIALASDRGLAGGYNSNINKLVKDTIDSSKTGAKLITVGLKSYEYFRSRENQVVKHYLGISEDPSFCDAQDIARLVLQMYESGEVDEVKLAYTEFESLVVQTPKIIKLLPATEVKDQEGEEELEASILMEFEPSPERVLDFLIPKYIESTIYGALTEAATSEQGSRQVAMESATENAEELIDELELTYNRARQEAITMEISEIVSGAEALQ